MPGLFRRSLSLAALAFWFFFVSSAPAAETPEAAVPPPPSDAPQRLPDIPPAGKWMERKFEAGGEVRDFDALTGEPWAVAASVGKIILRAKWQGGDPKGAEVSSDNGASWTPVIKETPVLGTKKVMKDYTIPVPRYIVGPGGNRIVGGVRQQAAQRQTSVPEMTLEIEHEFPVSSGSRLEILLRLRTRETNADGVPVGDPQTVADAAPAKINVK